jgi:hypothetical protein
MKKSLLLGLLGLSAASSFGQGFIKLDNYTTYGPNITYGPDFGALAGTGLGSGWTVGLYVAQGDVTGAIGSDPYGAGLPSTQNASFVLGTGLGSTTGFASANTGNTLGQFFSSPLFQASGNPNSVVTVEIVAYNGADYASSLLRGHSAAFTMTTLAGTSPTPAAVGSFMSPFSILIIPEPSGLTLMSVAGMVMLLFRHRTNPKI